MPARPATALFFVLAILGTWILQMPAALAARGVISGSLDVLGSIAMLGIFMPLVAALVANRAEGGRARAAFTGLVPRRDELPWGALALVLPGALYTGGALVFRAFGGEGVELFYPPQDPQRVAALFMVPLLEEIGWRGFALPRLSARFGPVRASVILGVLWAAWHVPMFMLAGVSLTGFALGLPFFVAGSFVFTWISLRSRGVLFGAVLLHMGAHLNNSNLPLPGNVAPLAIHTAAFVIFAAALLVFDRRAWRAASPRT